MLLPGWSSVCKATRQYFRAISLACPMAAEMVGKTVEDVAAYAPARMPAASSALNTPCAKTPLKPPAALAIASVSLVVCGIKCTVPSLPQVEFHPVSSSRQHLHYSPLLLWWQAKEHRRAAGAAKPPARSAY